MSSQDLPPIAALNTLLRERYGGKPPAPEPLRQAWPDTGTAPAALATLLAHRSVRSFTDEPLAVHTLEWLVAAAQSAPSSSNLQTWSVVAVQDPARRARLATLVGDQAHAAQAPLVLVWLADLARLRQLATEAALPLAGADYLDTFLMAVIDATLAAQNAVTAAEALGLGTVYLGAIRNRPEAVALELGLPAGVFAVVGLCIGHPDTERPAAIKPRLPQSAVLSHERYAPTDTAGDVAHYDRTMQAFYASQKMAPASWSEHSLKRLAGPEQLKGRHRLVEALQAQGIGLL
jgi:nitroreductase